MNMIPYDSQTFQISIVKNSKLLLRICNGINMTKICLLKFWYIVNNLLRVRVLHNNEFDVGTAYFSSQFMLTKVDNW